MTHSCSFEHAQYCSSSLGLPLGEKTANFTFVITFVDARVASLRQAAKKRWKTRLNFCNKATDDEDDGDGNGRGIGRFQRSSCAFVCPFQVKALEHGRGAIFDLGLQKEGLIVTFQAWCSYHCAESCFLSRDWMKISPFLPFYLFSNLSESLFGCVRSTYVERSISLFMVELAPRSTSLWLKVGSLNVVYQIARRATSRIMVGRVSWHHPQPTPSFC